MKTKIFISLVVLLLLACVFWFVTRPIKIGVVISTETVIGNEQNLAVRFYKEQYPRIGLRPVHYLIHNPPIKKEDIVKAYRDIEEAGVSVIIGGAISQIGIVLAEEAARSGIPTVGITTSTHLLSRKKDHFYRVVTSTELVGQFLADYLHRQKIARVALITSLENTAYVDPLADSFQQAFNGESLKIPFVSASETFEQMFAWNPEAVFTILPTTALIQVVKEVKLRKADILIMSSPWGVEHLLSMFSGPELNGIRTIYYTGRETVVPEYKDLITAFEQRYDIRATYASAFTYSALNMIYHIVNEVGTDRSKINTYLEQPRLYDLGYGNVYLDAFGDAIVQYYYIYEIRDRQLVLTETLKVQQFPWEKL